MWSKDIPVTLNYNHSEVVGSFTLTEEVEEFFKEGFQFIIIPLVSEEFEVRKVIGLTLYPNPAKEIST